MSLSSREIKEILAILDDSGWDEAEVSIGDVTLAVSKGGAGGSLSPAAPPTPSPPAATPPAPAPAAAVDGAPSAAPSAPAPAAGAGGGHVIGSPSVGVFWRAPEPGAAPFVERGAQVEVGQPLCIVEIMKLMQQVIADVAGVVTAIHVGNGEQVEFDTPLFSIAPASA
jgi:acetyl-CoA carboxylase biotin carboxyl carrier protein